MKHLAGGEWTDVFEVASDAVGWDALLERLRSRLVPTHDVGKAVNPNRKSTEDTRTPEELLDIIEAKGREIDVAIAELRASLATGD
jgi:hypothetical protein